MRYRHLTWLLALATAATVCADTRIMLPDFKRFADGEKKFIVETTMPGDFKSLDSIVLALLTLSPQAANKSVTAPFFDKTQPLYRSFRGLRKKGKTVTLRFTGDAMSYLDSAISLQDAIKGALEETIKLHAPDCKNVQYEVDGEVVTEWDP
ncbi:MAG: hypothetical protein QOD64_1515 [Verrucomicrobiota bacterium]